MRASIPPALAAAACLTEAPLSAQESETGGLAEILGVETGPAEFEDIEIDGLSAEALSGSEILGAEGDTIGEVADVLIIEDGIDKIVMSVGGVFGGGTRTLLIPLNEVQVQKDEDDMFRVRTNLTDDMVDSLAEYEAA